MTEEEFLKWYKEPVMELQKLKAGFPQMLIALPLIERYLRQKSGTGEERQLLPTFYNELNVVFPELNREHIDVKKFWRVFRHGLLHQVTMSETPKKLSIPLEGGLSYRAKIIENYKSYGLVLVNPTLFADRVLNTILNDFATFENATHSPNYPLPNVNQIPLPDTTSNVRISRP